MRKYKTIIQQWNTNKKFLQGEKCNSITFINKSTDNMPAINGYPLYYGEALSIDGNEDELDNSTYNISIDNTIGTPNLWIMYKQFE